MMQISTWACLCFELRGNYRAANARPITMLTFLRQRGLGLTCRFEANAFLKRAPDALGIRDHQFCGGSVAGVFILEPAVQNTPGFRVQGFIGFRGYRV